MKLDEALNIFLRNRNKYEMEQKPTKYLQTKDGVVFFVPPKYEGLMGCCYYLVLLNGRIIPTNPILIGDDIQNMKDL